MSSKYLLIAIAAFAVTASGAQAFSGNTYLNRSGLSGSQAQAFTVARELKQKGRIDEARDVLVKAGIDESALDSMRQVARLAHEAIEQAVADNDFQAFREATVDTPLYDLINTKEDFALFVEAHSLRDAGNYTEAREIMDELGVGSRMKHGNRGYGQRFNHHASLGNLTDEERDALRVARQANDNETVQEILAEAGVTDGQIRGLEMGKQRFNH